MSWHRIGLVLLVAPVLVLIVLGTAVTPTGAVVVLPVLAALVAFGLVVARADGAGTASPASPPTAASTHPAPRAEGSPPGSVHRRAGRVAIEAAVAALAAVLAVAGLTTLVGGATGPIVLLGALAAVMWAWPRWAGRFRSTRPTHDPTATGPTCAVVRPVERGLEALSTRALCAAWQGSYFELQETRDAAHRGETAELRRRYLDELERRDPDGLARWLTDDVRAAGTDPHQHFCIEARPAHRPAPRRATPDHPSRYRPGPRPPGPAA